jgi:hypothetical protein
MGGSCNVGVRFAVIAVAVSTDALSVCVCVCVCAGADTSIAALWTRTLTNAGAGCADASAGVMTTRVGASAIARGESAAASAGHTAGNPAANIGGNAAGDTANAAAGDTADAAAGGAAGTSAAALVLAATDRASGRATGEGLVDAVTAAAILGAPIAGSKVAPAAADRSVTAGGVAVSTNSTAAACSARDGSDEADETCIAAAESASAGAAPLAHPLALPRIAGGH